MINEEFSKRGVAHSIFLFQKQVQGILISFEANAITKLEGLSETNFINKMILIPVLHQGPLVTGSGIIGAASIGGSLMTGHSQTR